MSETSSLRRLRLILTEYDFAPVELVLALASTGWGGTLLSPPDIYATSPTWRNLAALAPEWVLGGLLAVAGVIHIASVLTLHTTTRRLALAVQIVVWSTVTIAVFTAGSGAIGWPLYALFSASAFWCWVRIRRYE